MCEIGQCAGEESWLIVVDAFIVFRSEPSHKPEKLPLRYGNEKMTYLMRKILGKANLFYSSYDKYQDEFFNILPQIEIDA